MQAEAVQADAVVKEGLQTGSLQTGGLQEEAVQAEAWYTQTDGVPSAPASQAVGCNADATSTFVWGPSEAFASNSCGSPFSFGADAAGHSSSMHKFACGSNKKEKKQKKSYTIRRHNGRL